MIKFPISSVFDVIIIKSLAVFIEPIMASTKIPFIIRPKIENKPISIPNILIEAIVKIESTTRRDLPTSSEEYFFIIIAIISVPPDEAAKLNKIAEPTELIKRVKTSSSILLPVREPLIGKNLSRARAVSELRIAT